VKQRVPTVDEISTVIADTIDDLTAKSIVKEDAVEVIRNIVINKPQRLKILDGDVAKSRFASKLGKGRLEKFYPLLGEAETEKSQDVAD